MTSSPKNLVIRVRLHTPLENQHINYQEYFQQEFRPYGQVEVQHCQAQDIYLMLRLDPADTNLPIRPACSTLPYQIVDIKEATLPKKRLNTKANSFQLGGTVKDKLKENLQDLDKLLEDMNQTKRDQHVVVVNELSPEVDSLMLFNLFCNYGNITRILKDHSHAYIYFQNEEYAQCALTFLKGHRFFGRVLELSLGGPPDEQYLKEYLPESHQNRFQHNASLQINPPSDTLHISNLAPHICQADMIWSLFKGSGQVRRIKFMKQDSVKNMCFIQFASIEESFRAIASLHGYKLLGRTLRLSFTRTRLQDKENLYSPLY